MALVRRIISLDKLNAVSMLAMKSDTDAVKVQKVMLAILTVALLAWGGFHALGAYFGGFGNENIQHDFRRAMVVLGCFGLFLGIWWVLILTHKPRPSRTDRQP
jgi:hypothetical protein